VPDAVINGTTIHYEIAGKGSPLVLLHGIGSNSRSWRRQLAGFSSDFQVIAWDAPGYGGSSDPSGKPSMRYYADGLRGLLDSLGISRMSLLGHSTGGVVAQEFYRAYPEYVRTLILADTRYLGSKSPLDQRMKSIRSMTPAELARERAPRLLTGAAPLAFTLDGTEIAAATPHGVQLWDVSSAAQLGPAFPTGVAPNAIGFDGGGKLVTTVTSGAITLWGFNASFLDPLLCASGQPLPTQLEWNELAPGIPFENTCQA